MRATRSKSTIQAVLAQLKTNAVEDDLINTLTIKISNSTAYVQYQKVDNNTYDLLHSSIPEKYQGHGLGHILAQRIFDHLVTQNRKFIPTCEFLRLFYNKNCDKYETSVILNTE